MKSLLSTKELEDYIKQTVNAQIENVSWKDFIFMPITTTSNDGIYIFSTQEEYLIIQSEKGITSLVLKSNNQNDILWEVLDIVVFHIALTYATQVYNHKSDFRRILFEKEIELFSLFGDDYKNKKAEIIKSIVEKHPFNDQK